MASSSSDIAVLARCAALDLDPARRDAALAILAAWMPAANALSRTMSQPAHQWLMPIVTFTHPADAGQETT